MNYYSNAKPRATSAADEDHIMGLFSWLFPKKPKPVSVVREQSPRQLRPVATGFTPPRPMPPRPMPPAPRPATSASSTDQTSVDSLFTLAMLNAIQSSPSGYDYARNSADDFKSGGGGDFGGAGATGSWEPSPSPCHEPSPSPSYDSGSSGSCSSDSSSSSGYSND